MMDFPPTISPASSQKLLCFPLLLAHYTLYPRYVLLIITLTTVSHILNQNILHSPQSPTVYRKASGMDVKVKRGSMQNPLKLDKLANTRWMLSFPGLVNIDSGKKEEGKDGRVGR
jgi:hypothetical protein